MTLKKRFHAITLSYGKRVKPARHASQGVAGGEWKSVRAGVKNNKNAK